MKKTIPIVFLFCSLLLLIMALMHWLWKNGLERIKHDQDHSIGELCRPDQIRPIPAGHWRKQLETFFSRNPALGLILVRDRSGSPVFLTSRLEAQTTKSFLEELNLDEQNILQQEIQLPDGQLGIASFVWSELNQAEYSKRMLVITISLISLLVFFWLLGAILASRIKRVPSPDQSPDTRIGDRTSLTRSLNHLVKTDSSYPLGLILARIDDQEITPNHQSQLFALLTEIAANFSPARIILGHLDNRTLVLLAPNSTLADLRELAEELRTRFGQGLSSFKTTASFGLAGCVKASQVDLLIERARRALEFAQQHGGDMVSSQELA